MNVFFELKSTALTISLLVHYLTLIILFNTILSFAHS